MEKRENQMQIMAISFRAQVQIPSRHGQAPPVLDRVMVTFVL